MGRARWERANVVGTRDVVHDTPLEQDRRHGPVHNACRRYPTIMVTTITHASCYRGGQKSLRACLHLSRIRSSREIREEVFSFYFSFVLYEDLGEV